MIKVNLDKSMCIRCGKVFEDNESFPFCGRACENVHHWEYGSIEGMTALFKDLELNFNKSEWCRSRSVKQWIDLLRGELDELEEGLKRNDFDNAREELGDVFYNSICLMMSMEHHRFSYLPEVLSGANKKLRARKPWIFDGSEKLLSAEEENALYKKMKEKLRNG